MQPSPAKGKDEKKPKESALCITVKRGNRVRLQHVVYKYQKGKFVVEQTWRLDDLVRFDPVDDAGECAFALEFRVGKDKSKPVQYVIVVWRLFGSQFTFRFVVRTMQERNDFFWLLIQQCEEHLVEQPKTSVDVLDVRLAAEGAHALEQDDVAFGDSIVEQSELLPPTAEKELEQVLGVFECVAVHCAWLNCKSAAQRIALADVGELVPRLGAQLVDLQSSAIAALCTTTDDASVLRDEVLAVRDEVG